MAPLTVPQPRSFTAAEFAEQQPNLICRDCKRIGFLTIEHNPNNNAHQVICGACGARCPIDGRTINIKHSRTVRRKEYPAGESLDEVWARYGDRCVVCSAPKHALITFGIGRQRQHVMEYATHEHQGPIVPMCVPCHENATQRQKLFWFWYRRYGGGNGG